VRLEAWDRKGVRGSGQTTGPAITCVRVCASGRHGAILQAFALTATANYAGKTDPRTGPWGEAERHATRTFID
jgi:hypothetical protein